MPLAAKNLPSPSQNLTYHSFVEAGLDVWIKRDDLIHPEIMGNKWRKLIYNIEHARDIGAKGILTFGGAYSNHIAATASACRQADIPCTGIIRGEELSPRSNPTLQAAHANGMNLTFVTRDLFKTLKMLPAIEDYPDHYVVPEGGTNKQAIQGCTEIASELTTKYDFIVLAMGTGGTMAGILQGLQGQGHVLGISSLKGTWMKAHFQQLLYDHNIPFTNYTISTEYHFGGYGKANRTLVEFINDFYTTTSIKLDPIYTGKAMYAMCDLADSGHFASGSKILFIHTGGLQGIAGFNDISPDKIAFN